MSADSHHRGRLAAVALATLPLLTQAAPLTFDWPAPAQARLVVEENTNDREVTTEMQLRVSPVEDGTKWRLDFTDVRIREINGNDVTAPEEQAHLPPTFKAMAQVVPPLIVDKEARIVAIPGVEEQLDDIIEQIPEQPPEVTRESLRLTLLDPNTLDLLRTKVDGYWHLWVGLWMDRDLEPGKRQELAAESDYFGVTVPSQGYFENLGPAADRPGATHLAFELVARGDPLREAIYKSLVKAFEQAEQPMPEELGLDALKSAERRERVDAIVDAETMRPHQVRSVTSLTLDYGDQGPEAKIEEQVFRFEWQGQ